MDRLKTKITDLAKNRGADLIGFANIERFDGAPEEHHPLTLIPNARTLSAWRSES